MDTEKIEVLLRAIELGSLSRAAEEYSYTPSAVSHILDGIEKELGARIIKRTYKGIEIAEGYGEAVENLRRIVSLKKQTALLVAEKQRRSAVTVATYSSVSKYVLPAIIKGFNKRFPDTNINITVIENIKEVYNEHRADLMIGEKIEGDSLCWEELMTDPYVAVFPKSDSPEEKAVHRSQLYEKNFIMATDGKIRAYIDAKKAENIINVDSHDDSSVIQLVKEGMGVAILPLLSVKSSDEVACRKLEPELKRVLGMAYRREDYGNKKELKKLIEYIRGEWKNEELQDNGQL